MKIATNTIKIHKYAEVTSKKDSHDIWCVGVKSIKVGVLEVMNFNSRKIIGPNPGHVTIGSVFRPNLTSKPTLWKICVVTYAQDTFKPTTCLFVRSTVNDQRKIGPLRGHNRIRTARVRTELWLWLVVIGRLFWIYAKLHDQPQWSAGGTYLALDQLLLGESVRNLVNRLWTVVRQIQSDVVRKSWVSHWLLLIYPSCKILSISWISHPFLLQLTLSINVTTVLLCHFSWCT